MEQHSLQIVVGMVGDGKEGDLFFSHQRFKAGIACLPCGNLGSDAFFSCQLGYVPVADKQRDSQGIRCQEAEFFIPVGFRSTDLMIDVDRIKRRSVLMADTVQHMQKRHGIGTARKSDQHWHVLRYSGKRPRGDKA